jgi:hypothetical protein
MAQHLFTGRYDLRMNEVIQEAAQVVLPFLGAGAGAAAQGFAEETGARLSQRTLDVIERLRRRIGGHRVDEPQLAEVVQEALGAGAVTEQDLRVLVAEVGRVHVPQQATTIVNGDQTARTIVNGGINGAGVINL